jgi:hypothetical protein
VTARTFPWAGAVFSAADTKLVLGTSLLVGAESARSEAIGLAALGVVVGRVVDGVEVEVDVLSCVEVVLEVELDVVVEIAVVVVL